MRLISENIETVFGHRPISEADAEDVEVVGFKINDTLEPEIWDDDMKMDLKVREQLMEITRDFLDGLPFDAEVEDVQLTGSLASYNWSKFSDVDLHIVIDFDTVDDDEELVRDYFNAKRSVWNLRHEIYIYGYEVEIYVENVGDEHVASGKYSVKNNDWIFKPTRDADVEIPEDEVKKKAASIMSQIERVEEVAQDDPAEAESLAERIKEKIRKMRQSGLESESGIYSVKNIAFKVLRRNGYLQRLSDIKTQSYDRLMSLAEIYR